LDADCGVPSVPIIERNYRKRGRPAEAGSDAGFRRASAAEASAFRSGPEGPGGEEDGTVPAADESMGGKVTGLRTATAGRGGAVGDEAVTASAAEAGAETASSMLEGGGVCASFAAVSPSEARDMKHSDQLSINLGPCMRSMRGHLDRRCAVGWGE